MEFKEYVEKYKNYFYVAELLGVLHDIGKSSLSFVKAATESEKEHGADKAHTLRELFDEDFIKGVDRFVNSLINSVSGQVENIIQPDSFMEILINHHSQKLGELATANYIADVVFGPGSDGIDSGFDKGNVSKKGIQKDGFFAINFAGKRQDIDINSLEEKRKKFQKKVVDILKDTTSDAVYKLNRIKSITGEYMKHALAETRIPANDVRLSDHLYSVGALSKTLMVKLLWEYLTGSDKKTSLIDWRFFKATARWQVLVIEWNFDRYIQNARRISDIAGRKVLLDRFKEDTEEIFEYKYPVGSLLFKDDTRMVFLFAGFEADFLKQKARFLFEEIKNKFPQELYGESTLRFMVLKRPSSNLLKVADLFSVNKNTGFETVYTEYFDRYIDTSIRKYISENGWKHVLCDICKTNLARPVRDETEENICGKCKEIRQKAKVDVSYCNQVFDVEDIGKKLCAVYVKFPVAIWLDGSMLKTVSVRLIETDKLKNTVEKLDRSFEEFKKLINDKGLKDITQLIEVVMGGEKGARIEGEFESLKSLIHLQDSLFKNKFDKRDYKYSYYVFIYILEELFIQDLSEISEIKLEKLMERFYHKYPSPSRIRRILQDIQLFFDELSIYLENNNIKHRELLRNSDDFAVLIPYDRSLDFVNHVYQVYKTHFPLVYGRFPVFVFGAFFKQKFPLYVVLEAIKNIDSIEFGHIELNGRELKTKIVPIDKNQSYLEKMYLNFENTGGAVIPYEKIQNGDKIKFYPSVFDFVIFDSPDRRFETLRYKTTVQRYSQDFEKYIDRLLFEKSDFESLNVIFSVFDRSNTAAVYKFMETLYKNYKGWSSKDSQIETGLWKMFVRDTVSNFFDKLTKDEEETLKTFSANLKIFEIFELWKYIREEKDE